MAQVENRKKSEFKFNYEIKDISEKDFNLNQWPFKVIITKDNSKIECRSLSALNACFEKTPYNLKDCERVVSRYTLLNDLFQKELLTDKDKMVYLAITNDKVYYKRKNDTEIQEKVFNRGVISDKDEYALLQSCLFNAGYFEKVIKDYFRNYNIKHRNQDERGMVASIEKLKASVKEYIECRKVMKTMDTSTPCIKLIENNFSKLEYFSFIYVGLKEKGKIIEHLYNNLYNKKYRIQEQDEQTNFKILKNIQALDSEIPYFSEFKKKVEMGKCCGSIKKLFFVGDGNALLGEDGSIRKEWIINHFNKMEMSNINENGCFYISKNVQKEKERINNIQLKEQQEKADKIREIIKLDNVILGLMEIMNALFDKDYILFEKGQEKNDIETKIWMKEFNPASMQQRINAIYNYRHKDINDYLPISTILRDLNNLEDFNIPKVGEWVNFFERFIVPTGFKDDRRTSKSIGCDLTVVKSLNDLSKENLDNLSKILKKIIRQTVELLEIYLGLQYATFGSYMARYGAAGLDIVKIIVSKLTNSLNTPFVLTSNVQERANEAFYLVHNRKNVFEDTFDGSKLQELEGPFYGFVNKYLEKINNAGVIMKKHTENDKLNTKVQIMNLIDVFDSVNSILNFACDINDLSYNDIKRQSLIINSVL